MGAPAFGQLNLLRGSGIGWALCSSMENPRTGKELIDNRIYHTIKEAADRLQCIFLSHLDHGA